MYPLFHIGPVELPAYGTIILIAYIIAIFLMRHRAYVYNIEKYEFVLASLLALVGMFVGAKIVYAVSVIPDYIEHWDIVMNDIPFAIYNALSGFVFYGGLLGGLLMIFLYCIQSDLNFLEFTNVVVPVIPFIHGMGRIGCFMGGCCYGIEYDGPFSITFPENEFVHSVSGVPRFPVQILECIINMIIFVILYTLAKKRQKPGFMLGIYFISYSVVRFSIEFLRGDIERGFFLGVSTSQWISLILIPVGLYFLVRKSSNVNSADL
ncbi:MAG: prolipoprotein diacylglyceryl transferase [Lachnospiraceae bacterium]|nr:prolipoprotein diacylglyceryl transferase [Lachnospiraceae bacterium]